MDDSFNVVNPLIENQELIFIDACFLEGAVNFFFERNKPGIYIGFVYPKMQEQIIGLSLIGLETSFSGIAEIRTYSHTDEGYQQTDHSPAIVEIIPE